MEFFFVLPFCIVAIYAFKVFKDAGKQKGDGKAGTGLHFLVLLVGGWTNTSHIFMRYYQIDD